MFIRVRNYIFADAPAPIIYTFYVDIYGGILANSYNPIWHGDAIIMFLLFIVSLYHLPINIYYNYHPLSFPRALQVCLIAVGEDHVWAGSFDTCIYVIDKVTRSCNQALVQHTDMVSDMTLTDSNRWRHGLVTRFSLIT